MNNMNPMNRRLRKIRVAVLLTSALVARGVDGAIVLNDYDASVTTCAGTSQVVVSFLTPIGVQYKVAMYPPSLGPGGCNGVGGIVDNSGERGYAHVATDWNHPFVVETDVRVRENFLSTQDGCVGGFGGGGGCSLRSWWNFNAGTSTQEKLGYYLTQQTTGAVNFFGVNEYNRVSTDASMSSYPGAGSLAYLDGEALAEGETPLAFSHVEGVPPPSSVSVNVVARQKVATTVNVPMPHASLVFIEGQMLPQVYAALPGSPAPRTFKDPIQPATRQQVRAVTSSTAGVVDGQNINVPGGYSTGPDLVTPACPPDITVCPRQVIYYGMHAALLNNWGTARAAIPSNLTGTGTRVIGEIVTFEVVPANPAYDGSIDSKVWAFQVASRLGSIVRRQPIYAESYHGGSSCTPPTLTLPSTMTARRSVWSRLPLITAAGTASEEIVVRLAAGGGLLQTNATVSGVTVTGSGSATVSLRGLRSAVQAALTQRIVWYWNATPDVPADSIAASIWRTAAPSCIATRVLGVQITEQNLLNIDFGGTSIAPYGWSDKQGRAATGFTTGDVWESISFYHANSLEWSDGTSSGVTVSINNSPTLSSTPSVGFSHPDAMFNDFTVRSDNTELGTTIQQLPAGTYDVYVYAHRGSANGNSRVTLRRAGTVMGTAWTTTEAISPTEPWAEGRQYVLFRNVALTAGQALEIRSAGGNGTGSGCINGMQLVRK